MQQYWFGEVYPDHCTGAQGDTTALAERFCSLHTSMESYVPFNWERALDCGFVNSRRDYLERLRDLCFFLAREKIVAYYQKSDIELLQMVRMLDELDTVINLLSERATEWYLVRKPGFSRKFQAIPAKKLVAAMKKDRGSPLGRIANQIESLASARTDLMKAVSARAETVAPNCSALVGGLVAARIISKAGGLEQLARLPSSTIQVLGAENALFTHLRAGAPSPKHGIIFQHRRIHSAPKPVRGRVARVLAAKLSIAARIDFYRGKLAPEFIDEAQKRIDAVGGEP